VSGSLSVKKHATRHLFITLAIVARFAKFFLPFDSAVNLPTKS